jgi:hypothetical protein
MTTRLYIAMANLHAPVKNFMDDLLDASVNTNTRIIHAQDIKIALTNFIIAISQYEDKLNRRPLTVKMITEWNFS